MGRPAAYRTTLLSDLRRQLAFASVDALHREIEASESLLDALDPETEYPPEFVLYRVTGYRPDRAVEIDAGDRLRGEDLRADLALLVLQLSERAPLAHDARRGGARRLDEVARSLDVSTRTLHRWRRAGLVTHRVRFEDGRVATAIFSERLERFRAQQPALVDRGRRFRRLDDAERERIARAVRALVESDDRTEARAATEVARAHGVSPETARQVARRARGAPARSSGARARVREDERRVVHRARRFAIDVARVADRLDRSPEAIRRIDRLARASHLRALAAEEGPPPDVDPAWRADLLETGRAFLDEREAGVAREAWVDATDLGACVARARERATQDAGALERIAAASRAARWMAVEAIATLDAAATGRDGRVRAPAESTLDPIETVIRESIVLRRRAAERLFARAVLRVDRVLDAPLEARGPAEARRLLRDCTDAIDAVLARFRPVRARAAGEREARAGTLERRLHLEIDRRLARGRWSPDRGRAQARAVPIDDPLLRFESERRLFDPVCAWARRRSFGDDASAPPTRLLEDVRLLDERFGWNGARPRTLAELATNVSVAGASRRVEAAVARLLDA